MATPRNELASMMEPSDSFYPFILGRVAHFFFSSEGAIPREREREGENWRTIYCLKKGVFSHPIRSGMPGDR